MFRLLRAVMLYQTTLGLFLWPPSAYAQFDALTDWLLEKGEGLLEKKRADPVLVDYSIDKSVRLGESIRVRMRVHNQGSAIAKECKGEISTVYLT